MSNIKYLLLIDNVNLKIGNKEKYNIKQHLNEKFATDISYIMYQYMVKSSTKLLLTLLRH
jgi:hypothetical protein